MRQQYEQRLLAVKAQQEQQSGELASLRPRLAYLERENTELKAARFNSMAPPTQGYNLPTPAQSYTSIGKSPATLTSHTLIPKNF